LFACSGDSGSSDASDGPSDVTDADTDIDTDSDTDTDTTDTDTTDTDTTDTDAHPPDPVTVGFTGQVVTVAGTPFGFDDSVHQTPVSGTFTYDRSVPDTEAGAMRGEYDHAGGGGPFTLEVGGKTVTGSDQPVVTVELFSHTFRWVDGPQIFDDTPFRVASIDGVQDASIEIYLSVTPKNEVVVFTSDALPPQFPFVPFDLKDDTVITFAVEDANGSLLMQLSQFTQTPPDAPAP
jgi:hypothetical protein